MHVLISQNSNADGCVYGYGHISTSISTSIVFVVCAPLVLEGKIKNGVKIRSRGCVSIHGIRYLLLVLYVRTAHPRYETGRTNKLPGTFISFLLGLFFAVNGLA